MLRAEDCICGTSTTGTGTLTLAACPVPPGGVDPFAAFTGQGLGTSQSAPMTYVIREFTDASFFTVKQEEKGIGSLTVGANIGATTLARTTPQTTATSCNTSTPTYSVGSPSAINIGTAANVLVFIGASASDIPVWSPYFDSVAGDAVGVGPVMASANRLGTVGGTVTNGVEGHTYFVWGCPMLVKRVWLRVATAYTGGTPVSNAFARIYAIASNGRPGKLLIDFGLVGTSNASLNATGNISSALASPGFMLLSGEYFLSFFATISGGTTGPAMSTFAGAAFFGPARLGLSAGSAICGATVTGGTQPAPDPANVTGYTPTAVATTAGIVGFSLASA